MMVCQAVAAQQAKVCGVALARSQAVAVRSCSRAIWHQHGAMRWRQGQGLNPAAAAAAARRLPTARHPLPPSSCLS